MKGKGLLNSLINNLPFELHLPGYNYCGPGTKLDKRLDRGDKGVNQLDEYCKEHDIAYKNSNNLSDRHSADRLLINKTSELKNSSSASFGEKMASRLVNNILKLKVKSGAGIKNNFKSVVNHAGKYVRKYKPKNKKLAIKLAYSAAKKLISSKKDIKLPRVIQVPKTGGILPLLPIFAGLSAIGGLTGGAAGIAKAVNDFKAAKAQLDEEKRHNKTLEAIAIGKGLYLKPYKTGLGLYPINKIKKN